MNRKFVFFLVALVCSAGVFAADSSSIVIRSEADARVSTDGMCIGQHNGRWFVQTSDINPPVYLSDEAMARIVSTMSSDRKALVLHGGNWGLLLSHIAENNLLDQPEAASSADSAAGSGMPSASHVDDHRAIMERMRSYRTALPHRTLARRPSVLAQQVRSYQALQMAGNKPALQAEQRRLEAELRKSSSGLLQRQLSVVKRMLAQENTELLHILRTRSSAEGEVALQKIQSKWPYTVRDVNPEELRRIRLHVEQVGFNELQAAKHILMLKREHERPQECLQAADIAGLQECKRQLELQRVCEADPQKAAELQRRIDRIQGWLDDPAFALLQQLEQSDSIEQAYLVRHDIESKPTNADVIRAMQHIWCQKEGAREFAGLSDAERTALLQKYYRHSAAAPPEGLVLDQVSIDSTNTVPSDAQSCKLEDVVDMTTERPECELATQESALSDAEMSHIREIHKQVHAQLVRDGVIDEQEPGYMDRFAAEFTNTLAHEFHPAEIKKELEQLAANLAESAHQAMRPINGVKGRSHLGHPLPAVVSMLEIGVGGAQSVVHGMLTPIQGAGKSPLGQAMQRVANLTPEELGRLSAKILAGRIKYKFLSVAGGALRHLDIAGPITRAGQIIAPGQLSLELAGEAGVIAADAALVAEIAKAVEEAVSSIGVVMEAGAAPAAAASAANTLLKEAQKGGGGGQPPREGAGAGVQISDEGVIRVDKMRTFFEHTDFGKSLKSKVQKLKGRQYDGKSIYKVTEKVESAYLKKGDHFYIDAAHMDHIEVFDKRGNFKVVLKLDGAEFGKKTRAALIEGREIKRYL